MEAAEATCAAAEGGGKVSGGVAEPAPFLAKSFQIDETYEFSAPRFFDFLLPENDEQIKNAELWFETALSYAQSPFVNGIKGGRSNKQESICCDFGEIEEEKISTTEKAEPETQNLTTGKTETKEEEEKKNTDGTDEDRKESIPIAAPPEDNLGKLPNGNSFTAIDASGDQKHKACSSEAPTRDESKAVPSLESAAQKTPAICRRSETLEAENSSRNKSAAKKIASLIRNPSSLKARTQPASSTQKTTSVRGCRFGVDAQENQAPKRQKLEGGLSRQIHNMKSINRTLVHKSKPDLPADGPHLLYLSARPPHPAVKQEEIQRRPRLTLTRPKEPELETAHRVRAVRIKSSAELEEEMLASMPKFKARPINKKILEAPNLLPPQRSTPHPPEFQEFNLKTMKRASRNAGTTTTSSSSLLSSSMDSSSSSLFYDHFKMKRLTEPRVPHLETSFRARPPRVKSSQELELEELEKIPKFKARPLNKKIFEARGEEIRVSKSKSHVTIPQEFHFATDERLGPPGFIFEAFDKLSLKSESRNEHHQAQSRLTVPNPFHLHTEERGLEKERDLTVQLQREEKEKEKARVPKATPYPYTTDFPVIPPKPAPKECTKPEGFQLESLVRHEEIMQKKMEEMERLEREEAQKRVFRAQPILAKDPFPLAKRERKPLTEVQEFDLHVDQRATEREEFDKKIKEKESMYKRMREQYEAEKKDEEEREVKQMRKTMVPTARPLPNFANPFLPHKSSKEITRPKSPALKVATRLMKRTQQIRSHTTCLSRMR